MPQYHFQNLSFSGWLIVLFYGFACYRCFQCIQLQSPLKTKFIWSILTFALLMLLFIKLLTLDDYLTEFFRYIAKEQDWYSLRQGYQFIAGLIVSFFTASILLVSFYFVMKYFRQFFIPFVGFCLLILLYAIRVISFHYTDQYLASPFLFMSKDTFFEVLGIALIYWTARRTLKKSCLQNNPLIELENDSTSLKK